MSIRSRLEAIESAPEMKKKPCIVCRDFPQPLLIKVRPDYSLDPLWLFPCDRCGYAPGYFPSLRDATGNYPYEIDSEGRVVRDETGAVKIRPGHERRWQGQLESIKSRAQPFPQLDFMGELCRLPDQERVYFLRRFLGHEPEAWQ